MNLKMRGAAIALVLVLLLGSFSLVEAWPDTPPAKAFISGPGIEGQVQITDKPVLDALRLGGVEDMARGVIARPAVAWEGFKITRYFDGGTFHFGDLTYYPNAEGTRGAVYFEDGPMLEGDHTAYNNRWLYATASGDQVLQGFLKKLGVGISTNGNSEKQASTETVVLDALPDKIIAGKQVVLGFTFVPGYKIVPVSVQREGESHHIVLEADASGTDGHYVLRYTFPDAGVWNWTVRKSYIDPEIPMPELEVSDPNAPAAVESDSVKPAQASIQKEAAVAKPLVEPTQLLLGVLAAGIGVIGIAGVMLQQKRRK